MRIVIKISIGVIIGVSRQANEKSHDIFAKKTAYGAGRVVCADHISRAGRVAYADRVAYPDRVWHGSRRRPFAIP